MLTASRSVMDAMQSISAMIEENTASTGEMAAQAVQVNEAIQSIAAVSQEQSSAAEHVSDSTSQMTSQMDAMASQAEELATTADQLRGLVARFKLASVADEPAHGVIRLPRAA